MRNALKLVALIALLSMSAWPCTWAVGYFQRVTSLGGTLVKQSDGLFGTGLFRRTLPLHDATLILYHYHHPYWLVPENTVTSTKTDNNGRFELPGLEVGHYTLAIERGELREFFDVEVIKTVPETESVVIDVSPVTPDCKGGHTFTTKFRTPKS